MRVILFSTIVTALTFSHFGQAQSAHKLPAATRTTTEDVPVTMTNLPFHITLATAPIKRDVADDTIFTYGYIDGRSDRPVTCPEGYTATNPGSDVSVFGCCNEARCTSAARACVDDSIYRTQCSGLQLDQCSSRYATTYTSFIFCLGIQSGCATTVIKTNDDPQDYNGYSMYACGQTETLLLAWQHVLDVPTSNTPITTDQSIDTYILTSSTITSVQTTSTSSVSSFGGNNNPNPSSTPTDDDTTSSDGNNGAAPTTFSTATFTSNTVSTSSGGSSVSLSSNDTSLTETLPETSLTHTTSYPLAAGPATSSLSKCCNTITGSNATEITSGGISSTTSLWNSSIYIPLICALVMGILAFCGTVIPVQTLRFLTFGKYPKRNDLTNQNVRQKYREYFGRWFCTVCACGSESHCHEGNGSLEDPGPYAGGEYNNGVYGAGGQYNGPHGVGGPNHGPLGYGGPYYGQIIEMADMGHQPQAPEQVWQRPPQVYEV